jgi:hypothetical protein
MTRQTRVLYFIGAILTIAGSFLPWWCEGDLIWYCYKGIYLCLWVDSWLQDNGGLLVVLLSVAIVGLAFRPPRLIKRPVIWNVAFGAVLTLLSIYHIRRWLVRYVKLAEAIGAPVIRIGLVMVALGSVLLLSAALVEYRRETLKHSNLPERIQDLNK